MANNAEKLDALEQIAARFKVDTKDSKQLGMLPNAVGQVMAMAATPPLVISVVMSRVNGNVLSVGASTMPTTPEGLVQVARALEVVARGLQEDAMALAQKGPEAPAAAG